MFATSIARPLPPAAADRLIKIAGLLGSDHAGEAASAAAAATRIVRSHGMTWQQLLEPIVLPRSSSARSARKEPPPPCPTDRRRAATACLRHPLLFTRWECTFLENLLGFRRLSAKQADVLARLYAQVQAATGDAA
jgi:hypothetical protein